MPTTKRKSASKAKPVKHRARKMPKANSTGAKAVKVQRTGTLGRTRETLPATPAAVIEMIETRIYEEPAVLIETEEFETAG